MGAACGALYRAGIEGLTPSRMMRQVLILAIVAAVTVSVAANDSMYEQQTALYEEMLVQEFRVTDSEEDAVDQVPADNQVLEGGVDDYDDSDKTLLGKHGVVEKISDPPGLGDGFDDPITDAAQGRGPAEKDPSKDSDSVPNGKLEGYRNYPDKILGDANVKDPVFSHPDGQHEDAILRNKHMGDAKEDDHVDEPLEGEKQSSYLDHWEKHVETEWHEMDDGYPKTHGAGSAHAVQLSLPPAYRGN